MTVVNLNKFRKAKRQAEKATSAKANRRKHGRTKAEKAQDAAEGKRHQDIVDGAETPAEDKD